MIISNHDNEKFPLKKDVALVINNNSNVYIDLKNSFSSTSQITTITINKGNTVNLLLIASDNYDVVYGNSTLYSKQLNFADTKHLWLNDYNFPAARSRVNGYKSNYAILLNDGQNPYWTSISAGVLLDDYETTILSSIPTRMNGYTATVNSIGDSIIDKKYNGTLIVNNFSNSITANFVYNLQLNNSSNSTYNNPFHFSNITYLKINGGINNNVTLKNVRYSLLNTTRKITLQNSSIAVNNLLQVSLNGYNTIISYNVEGLEYRNYILKGVRTTNIAILNTTRNILFNNPKYLKQTAHAIDSQNGYVSNLPVGAILWYPEVWASFNPKIDKDTNTGDDIKYIVSRGEPDTTDWALCDGREIPEDCLYTQLYGLTHTPNYKVDLKFYLNDNTISSYHFLTLQSIMQFSPGTLVTAKPTYVALAHALDPEYDDNKHKKAVISLHQNLNGAYDMQMKLMANWRMDAYVNMHFVVDLTKLNIPQSKIRESFNIKFSSPCCCGNGWWDCWTGGNLASESTYRPSEMIGGVEYLAGWPISEVSQNSKWMDTINCPKMVVRLKNSNCSINLDVDDHNLYNPMKMFTDTWGGVRRAYYNGCWPSIVKNMRLLTHPDGGDDYTPVTDCVLTPNLPWHWKRYRIAFNEGAAIPLTVLFDLQFMMGIATSDGYYRCKPKNQYWKRWLGKRNRDNTLNGAPYHTFVQADWYTLFCDMAMCYGGVEMLIAPSPRDKDYIQQSWEMWQYDSGTNHRSMKGDWGNHPFCNMGLFRRLNPYIKIDDKGLKKNYQDLTYSKKKLYKDPVTLIKVRKEIDEEEIYKLNTDSTLNNKLSACYCLDDWHELDNNIIDFNYIVLRADLQDLFESVESGATVQIFNSSTANIWEDRNYTYIQLLEGNDFYSLLSSTQNYNIREVDSEVLRDILPDDWDIYLKSINDVTNVIAPLISTNVESDGLHYYYNNVDVTNCISGITFTHDTSTFYFDYLNGKCYNIENNEEVENLSITDNSDGYDWGVDSLPLPNGLTKVVNYDAVNDFFYYLNDQVSGDVTNYIRMGCNIAWTYGTGEEALDITSCIVPSSIGKLSGASVYYSKANNIYYTFNDYDSLYEPNNLLINKLLPYYDKESMNDTFTDPNIEYSYYNVTKENGVYKISANSNLIRLAANKKRLENTITALSTQMENGYINTSDNSLPYFYSYIDSNNNDRWDQEIEELVNTINGGVGILKYYFLGTKNEAMVLTEDVSNYQYEINYKTAISGGKIGNYNETSTTYYPPQEITGPIPAYPDGFNFNVAYSTSNGIVNGTLCSLLQNGYAEYPANTTAYIPTQYVLISAILSANKDSDSNPVFEADTNYILSTTASITKDDANNEIFHKLFRYSYKLALTLDRDIFTFNLLSAVLYNNYCTTINTIEPTTIPASYQLTKLP